MALHRGSSIRRRAGLWVLLLVCPSLALAQPTITISVPDSEATEAGQTQASFTVTRTNDENTASALQVNLSGSGSAGWNSDWTPSNLTVFSGSSFAVVIPANQLSQTVVITPRFDEIEEGD